jgi:AcrR family transcriptional regulator
MPRAAKKASPLGPQDWVQAATDMLVNEGIDAVRVDVLAKRMAVTRGSFYWHFKDRQELLQAVLQAWREQTTENLTHRLETAHTDPQQQLRDVLSLPHRGRAAERAARIELAIRAWARRDDKVRRVVDESDASRIAYIAQVFSALGFAAAEARHRAVMAYSLDVACSQLTRSGGVWDRDELLKSAEATLTQPQRQPQPLASARR